MYLNFKDAISAYQQRSDPAVLDDILTAVETDFMENPTRRYRTSLKSDVSISLAEPELYIAYRIKAIREKAVKRAWYIREPVWYAYSELNRYLSIIAIDLRVRLPFEPVASGDWFDEYEITPELISWLRHKEHWIERRFREEGFEQEHKFFIQHLTKIGRAEERALAEEARIQSEVMGDMTEALKYALKYVDTSRSDKEIVSYINRAIMTRYYTAQSKRNGLRRVRKGGVDQQIKPYFASPTATVIGRYVDETPFNVRLSRRESDFIQGLERAVVEDMKVGKVEGYGVSETGKYIISGKYAAQITGLSYETARRRLSRIRKKYNHC